MTEADFDGGVRYFLTTVGMHSAELIARCKAKYPALNGRCVNFVKVPFEDVGTNWRYGFVIDHGRYAISEPRLEEAITGIEGAVLAKTREEIAGYNPDTHVLFMFVCNVPNSGAWVRWGQAGRNESK